MKKIIVYISLLCCQFINAQNTLDADIITKNQDTLRNKKIKIIVTPIGLMETSDVTIILKVKIFDSIGNKEVIHGRDIQRISFTDYKGVKRVYVTGKNENELVEIVHNGKIKWYKEYRRHGYDGSIMIFYVWTNDKGLTEDTYMFRSPKKVLKRITASKPELATLIDEGTLDEEKIKLVLGKYDE